jgi:predicted O-methyltransferase YrrM
MENGNTQYHSDEFMKELDPLLNEIRGIEGWLSDHEALFLYHAAVKVQVTGEVVEIGSWKGKSTIALASGVRDSGKRGKVWAVDPHKGFLSVSNKIQASTLKEFHSNIRKSGLEPYVKPLVMTSRQASRMWQRPVRLIFIDGIHDYKHASEDYEAWKGKIVPGGIVAFHDCFCGEQGVWQAVRERFLIPWRLAEVGTIGSILYGVPGSPGPIRVFWISFKIALMGLADTIHSSKLPGGIKALVVHKIIRTFLINRWFFIVRSGRMKYL